MKKSREENGDSDLYPRCVALVRITDALYQKVEWENALSWWELIFITYDP